MRRTLNQLASQTTKWHGHDAGQLVLRATAGGLLFGHATQNLFGWFGGSRRPSEIEQFRALGYRPAAFFARSAGVAELVASISLVTGTATPFGGALLAATSTQAIQTAKWQNGPWEQDGGYEYLLLLGASGMSLAFTGPGQFSADRLSGLDLGGRAAGLGAVFAAAVSLILPHRLPEWHPGDRNTSTNSSTHETEVHP